jgi:hypothetical protein
MVDELALTQWTDADFLPAVFVVRLGLPDWSGSHTYLAYRAEVFCDPGRDHTHTHTTAGDGPARREWALLARGDPMRIKSHQTEEFLQCVCDGSRGTEQPKPIRNRAKRPEHG